LPLLLLFFFLRKKGLHKGLSHFLYDEGNPVFSLFEHQLLGAPTVALGIMAAIVVLLLLFAVSEVFSLGSKDD
jgi:hypothetical protein